MNEKKKNYYLIDKRKTFRKGGSLAVPLPVEVKDSLRIGEKDNIWFIRDLKTDLIVIMNENDVSPKIRAKSAEGPITLEFAVSKQLASKILKKKKSD